MAKKACPVCNHKQRADIERVLFKMTAASSSVTTEQIAEEFDITAEDVRRHMLFHTPYNDTEGTDSIVRQVKIREADFLMAQAMEYAETAKALGEQVRAFISENSTGGERIQTMRGLNKPLVDLYINSGAEARKTVQSIAEINNLLNGPKDNSVDGLTALAQALNMSRQTQASKEEDGEG